MCLRGGTKPSSCSSHLSAIFPPDLSHPSTPSNLAAPSLPFLSSCAKGHLILYRYDPWVTWVAITSSFSLSSSPSAVILRHPCRCHLPYGCILPSHLPPSGHLSSFDLGEDMGGSIFPNWVPPLKMCTAQALCLGTMYITRAMFLRSDYHPQLNQCRCAVLIMAKAAPVCSDIIDVHDGSFASSYRQQTTPAIRAGTSK